MKIQDGQIASRLQSLNAADVATTGAQDSQAEHVLLRYWPNRLLQGLADHSVEVWIRDGNFLRQGGRHKAG